MSLKRASMLCPCHSHHLYEACCAPYHKGERPAPRALELMRSRFSAYALGLVDYIIDTTHPSKRQKRKEWRKEIETFSQNTHFAMLDILEFVEKKEEASVTFHATLFQGEKDLSFTEQSYFERSEGKWYYLRGEISPTCG